MKDTKEKLLHYFTNISRIALYIIAALMLLYLVRYALPKGWYLYEHQSAALIAAWHMLLMVLLTAFSFLTRRYMERFIQKECGREWILLGIAAFLLFAVCTLRVKALSYQMEGDQLIVWYCSVLAAENQFPMFVFGGQVGIYPNYKGLIFLYEMLFRIFHTTDPVLIGFIHACLAPVTLAAGYLSVREIMGRKTAIHFMPFMVCCLPYIIYTSYVYGDVGAICFTFCILAAIFRGLRLKKIGYYGLACIGAALGVLVRTNMWIVLIGICIGLAYQAIREWHWRAVVLAFCIMGSALFAGKGVALFYEVRSGEPIYSGMPAALWIAMGLQDGYAGPGYYNNYSKEKFYEAGCDTLAASQIGKDYIKERLLEFRSDPAMAKDFFHRKLYLQWEDSLFESVDFLSRYSEEPAENTWEYYFFRGEGYLAITKFCTHMQFIVYAFAFLGVLYRFLDKKEILYDVPLIIFVGGFLFSVIWEAKGRYILPYFMLLFIYAAYGWVRSAEMTKKAVGFLTAKKSGH